jgi:isopenicillin N synthase-like dioxygenase
MTEALPLVALDRDPNLDAALDRACREFGFFYVTGHGVDPRLVTALAGLARNFFAQPVDHKLRIAMSGGGRAWRGYFPVGGELTSGRPDRKEGVYFGTELALTDPRVRAGLPLHGPNLFPDLPGFRERVLEYMGAVTTVGQRLLCEIASGLGLQRDYILERYTRDPTVLFRIFNYPPGRAGELGVGEHTDYGFLTLLWQDETGGLEVQHQDRWLDVPPIPGSFVCNVGDMLERLTGGRYVSALHRARNNTQRDRISMPLFLDPRFDAVLLPISAAESPPTATSNVQRARERWDGLDLTTLKGTYGDYLTDKVSKVFPELQRQHLDRGR